MINLVKELLGTIRAVPDLMEYLIGRTGRQLKAAEQAQVSKPGGPGRILNRVEQFHAENKFGAELRKAQLDQHRAQSLANTVFDLPFLNPADKVTRRTATASREFSTPLRTSNIHDPLDVYMGPRDIPRIDLVEQGPRNFHLINDGSKPLSAFSEPFTAVKPESVASLHASVARPSTPIAETVVEKSYLRAAARDQSIFEKDAITRRMLIKQQNLRKAGRLTPSGEAPKIDLKVPNVPRNSKEYEKAYASRKRAKDLLVGKLLPATGFLAAGYTASTIIKSKAKSIRTARGDQEYESMYGTSAETASGLFEMAGKYLAGATILGVNPIQNYMKSKKTQKLAKVLGRKQKRLAGIEKKFDDQLGPMREKDKLFGATRADYFPLDPQMVKESDALRNVIKGTEDLRKASTTKIAGQIDRVKKKLNPITNFMTKGMGLNRLIAGTTVAAVSTPDAGVAVGAAVGGATALAVKKLHMDEPVRALTIAGTIGAGISLGLGRPAYPAAEGNITEMSSARESTTSRLNYSTAGLVQAIHNNRRRI